MHSSYCSCSSSFFKFPPSITSAASPPLALVPLPTWPMRRAAHFGASAVQTLLAARV